MARPGGERPELEGREAETEGEDGDVALPGPGEGAGGEMRARRGPRPLAFLSPREEAPQTAGCPTGGKGRGRRRRHSGNSRRAFGLRCPAKTWRRRGGPDGPALGPRNPPGKSGASASGAGGVVLGVLPSLGLLGSELSLSGGGACGTLLPLAHPFSPTPLDFVFKVDALTFPFQNRRSTQPP